MNTETLVNQIFEKEPNAMVVIAIGNEPPKGIVYLDDWEHNTKLQARCRTYEAPIHVQRADYPIIGTIIKLNVK
jgi:Ni,Fe-hydrogenase III small subunit